MSKWGRLGILMCLIISTQVWASIGKVSLLKGEATANRDNQTIVLANGATLEEHDLISTRANSQIQLTFEDKTVITLGSESILDINQYLNDAQEPKAKFKFNQGTFKSITGNIGKKAPENFNLETKTATIGIRGTTVLGQTNMPPQNGREQPDIIGCSSGKIVVVTPMGSVEIGAGFATTISPNQAPTAPQPLSTTPLTTAGSTQSSQNGNVILASSTSSNVNEVANNTLQESTQNSVTNTANTAKNQSRFYPSIGLTGGTLDYEPFKSSISYYIQGIDSTLTFGLRYRPYNVDLATGDYTHSNSSTTLLLENIPLVGTNGWTDLSTLNNTLTGFKYITNTLNSSNNPVTLSLNNSNIPLSSYALFQDINEELFIASLNNGSAYTQRFILGQQSSSLPSSTVLYYADPFDSISPPASYPELTGSSNALAINTSNRNALGFSLDGDDNKIIISIGNLDNHNSLSLTDYSLTTSNNGNYISNWDYTNSSGAIYGSTNQAIGLNGIETTYNFDGDYISNYGTTTDITVKTTSSTPVASQRYNAVQTLDGLITDTSGSSDLTIQINKNTGAVSVTSSLLSIDATDSSSKSAYIHDDYFAAITLDTYNHTTPALTSYLIAIPMETQDDYVSWGYWGKSTLHNTNQITTNTSPFSTWVAGVKTDTSYINNLVSSANQTFTYNGSVIGSTNESGQLGYITTSGNSAAFSFNFATSTYSSAIAFTSSKGNVWSSSATLALNGNAFNATNVNTTVNGSNTSTTGAIQGSFYGPTAQAVAGNFALGTGAYIASGSFKAIK